MLTENDIVQAVARHLESIGYRIESALSTEEHGIDIVAEHPETKKRVLVEAKGGTSSKKVSNRYGKPFSLNQAKTHVSVAFYWAAKLREKFLSQPEDVEIALAFPTDEAHPRLVENISSALSTLGITVFFVNEDKQVTRR